MDTFAPWRLRRQLVRASVSIYYCITLPDVAPKNTRDKLQHVLNVAARVTSNHVEYDQGCLTSGTAMLHSTLAQRRRLDSVRASRCTKCQHRLASRYLAWALATYGICNLVTVASETFCKSDCRHMEEVLSVIPGHLLGTLMLTLKGTTFLCLLLDASSNISTSHSTSTLGAFEVILQLTHYPVYKLLAYLLAYFWWEFSDTFA